MQMYRRAGCPWCLAWDREVGPIYGKTDIGRAVPLRMIDLDGERPQVVLKGPVRYTPTFVLVEDGRELGRIEGYPGDSFFWGLLERLVRQRDSGPRTSVPTPATERGKDDHR
ncbi:MAG: thioredoxin family protein [Hyphomicrobiales bacterium]|nr:thioredoxin family protein [Hyphomicrobiales bacterium]